MVVCVPYVDLCTAVEATKGTNIAVGAENCHWETSGAFTGEISPSMLTAIGVEYVIIGHSERRTYFGETDITVNKRVCAALQEGLKVILCVGEYLEQREQSGITAELVAMQTKIALQGVSKEDLKRIIIAYEPVWAIGTGRTATAEQANEVCSYIRKTLAELYCESLRKWCNHPIRWLNECEKCSRIAGSAGCRRRPDRRCFPESSRFFCYCSSNQISFYCNRKA